MRTPGPWHINSYIREWNSTTLTGSMLRAVTNGPHADGHVIAGPNASPCEVRHGGESGYADARFIVKACNAHDGLVAALGEIAAYAAHPDVDDDKYNRNEILRIARAAL